MSASPPVPSSPSNATTSRAGLLSSADKTKLDGVAVGATATPLSSATPQAVGTAAAGSSGNASRADHVHDLPAVGPGAGAIGTAGITSITLDVKGRVTAATPLALVPQSLILTAGGGLTGTGDLSAPRTFAVGANADGSITVNADDIQVGILATDAQHGARGGGTQHAAATGSANGFMSAADKAKFDALIATQALGTTRYLALDFTGGNDASAGQSDVSMAAAGAVAKKTLAGLLAILPRLGDDRTTIVAIKPRDASGTSYGENLILDGYRGFQDLHVVGTTDFSDSATDRIRSGFVTAAAGPGGGGVWTCAGGATVSALSISTGSLPASPAVTLLRLRFTGNVTAGLANVCRTIQVHDTTNITLLEDSSLAPAAGDTFLIERPGVVFDTVRFSNIACRLTFSTRGLGASTGDIVYSNIFCEGQAVIVGADAQAGQSSVIAAFRPNPTSLYVPLGGGSVAVGMGMRAQTALIFDEIHNLTISNSGCIAGITTFRQCREGTQNGLVFLGQVQLNACGIVGVPTVGFGFAFGRSSAGFRDHLLSGGNLAIVQSNAIIQNTVIQNVGANPAVRIFGDSLNLKFVSVTGSVGNTNQGVSPGCTNSKLIFITSTVTGPTGDITLQANYTISYTDLTVTNTFDTSGNEIAGSAGHIVGESVIVTNSSGGIVGVGEIVHSNGTSNQVTSAQADTLANATGPLLVSLHTTTVADKIIATPLGRGAWVLFDGVPTVNALAYLSPGTIRKATTTVPATSGTNQRRRLGYVLSVNGNFGQIVGTPELLAVLANGGA